MIPKLVCKFIAFYITVTKICFQALNNVFVNAVIDEYDYVFSENGLVAHKDGKLIGTQVLRDMSPET